MSSYEVKFWDIKKLADTTRGRCRVRWSVAGREHHRSFATKALADGFLSDLKRAAREGRPFDEITGEPVSVARARARVSWYEHARDFAELKWSDLAPKSRRSAAEALTTLTVALIDGRRRGAPDPQLLRRALFGWAFNPATRHREPPEDIARALAWASTTSLPVGALEDPTYVRTALKACARKLDGTPAAATTTRRKRALFHQVCGYAIERGLLPANPVDRIMRKTLETGHTVDRRVVANPAQVRDLLAAVRAQGKRGQHLEAFFGCLYYAALRPAEAVALRHTDCVLPKTGWGRIDLAGSEPRAGRAWTDTGTARQPQGLKHRATTETRPIPIPPDLVYLLRNHLNRYGTTPDGRLFRSQRGNAIQDSAYAAVWKNARTTALTPTQAATPLAARPYDLRHAAVSLWLNAGLPVTEVARRAGHGIAVLLKVYANCIDGQTNTGNDRITHALNPPGGHQ